MISALIRPFCLKCRRKMQTLGDGKTDSQTWICVTKNNCRVTIPLNYRWPQR